MIEPAGPDRQAASALRSNKPDLTLLVVGILVLQVVLVAGLLVRINQVYRWMAESRAVANSSMTDISLVRDVSSDDDPFIGPVTAAVTIVEFSDFGCGACRQAQETLAQIRATYGDEVRIVVRDFPLEGPGSSSFTAALAAECADEQGAFWAMHDLLFANQPAFDQSSLRSYASSLELDLDQFQRCMVSQAGQAEILHDYEAGVSYGVGSTPTFFVNGRRLVGAVSFSVFERAIGEALQGH